MKGIDALDFFLENWYSKLRYYGDFCEFDAMVEYRFGKDIRLYNTYVRVGKFFERKISINNAEDINEFFPEEVEFDVSNGNLYIKRNLFEIKIAPKIY